MSSISYSSVWTEQLKICASDVDFTRRATSASLCRYFLEAAWNHAESLGMGFGALMQQGQLWVLSRLLLQVRTYPVWGSTATLRTWPRPVRTVFAMRDFEFVDEVGTPLAAGSSAWLVLDAASKRPQRLAKLFPALGALPESSVLARDPDKLRDGGPWEQTYSASVRYTDIDVNRHVNSVRYIGWVLDAYPFDFHRHHRVRVLEVNYLGEMLEGQALTIRTRQSGGMAFCHSLAQVDGEEVCRARLEWEAAPGGLLL